MGPVVNMLIVFGIIVILVIVVNIYSPRLTEGFSSEKYGGRKTESSLNKKKAAVAAAMIVDGEGSNSSTFLDNMKAVVVNMENALQVDKYRDNYSNILISTDEYLNLLLLRHILNVDVNKEGGPMSILEDIATIQKAKNALSELSEYIDNKA
tara:strand:+ start:90 stop:545 length:456 start_codon:yes stop_codon:yes gene_type:complete